MKLKNYFIAAALSLSTVMTMSAQQPYAGCWFPDDVRDWTPEYDKDAKFNRSRVPLKKRLSTPVPMKANEEQFTEGQTMLASVSAKMCGQCSAQGFDNFIGYNPTYWQYVEKLVNWGGADDEGIIVFPPAGTIDAAHAQGVKVFANIFLQGTVNGKPWAKQLVTCEDDKYPYAEQLYKMAKYYGIDGYFINDESHQGLRDTWIKWVKYFYEVAEADGDTNMEIVWYDATNDPDINILKTNPRTSHFIDYGRGPQDYRSYADRIGSTVEETFHRIYGGIECGRSGLKGFSSGLDRAYPRTGHVGSVALFCVEEHTWKDNVNSLFFTENVRGSKAYDAMRRTFEYERATYVNDAGDPSKTVSNGWRGFAGCLVESTSIDGLPFITSFNVGNGKHRFAEGVKMGTRDWSHAGMQSYLPTWRWWIENGDGLKESIDWDDAYCGGNSMLISGTLSAGSHIMRLYKMIAKVDNGGTVRLVYKSNNPTVPVLHLSTESSVNPDTEINAKGTSQTNGWTVAEYDLAPVAGKTVYMVAFDLKADAAVNNYEMRLGQMVMVPAGYSPKSVDITNVNIERALGEDGGDLRVTWDWADNSDLDRFDIYTVDAAGVRTLVGQTRDEGFYIPEIKRQGVETGIDVEITAIMKDGSKGTVKAITAEYPRATAPVVTIKSGRSYTKSGLPVSITAIGTCNPTSCQWILPEGMTFADGFDGTEFTTQVKADAVGSYTVTARLANEIGTGECTSFVVEVLSEGDYIEIKNVALNKSIHSESAAVGSQQSAHHLLDGDRTPSDTNKKWWSVSKNPYAVVDLGDKHLIYGFAIFDCKSGNETYSNIDNYRILVSEDGENWNEVVHETKRGADDVKYDYIAPVKGRYVRLAPYGHNNVTTRVWEFEVYGRDAISIGVEVPSNLIITSEKAIPVKVSYNLKGEERQSNFNCAVEAGRYLSIGDISENKADQSFNFDLNAEHIFGTSQLKVTVTNGEVVRERIIDVTVDVADAVNAIKGLPVEVRKYSGNYSSETSFTSVSVNTLTDGNTSAEALEAVEEASTYEYDVWNVIDCGLPINLSKVKVYLSGNNYGTNINDDEGIVNHDIAIKVSDDGSNWIDLHTFSNLGRVDELSYVLPDFRPTRYIAIACNLNPLFYASLAEIEVYEQITDMLPVTEPVAIKSGYNYDMIAETEDPATSTTGGFYDDDIVFFTSNVKEDGALCGLDGKLTTRNGIPYQLGPLNGNNALKVEYAHSETLEFDNPVQAQSLHVLLINSNIGKINATVNYEDGTSEPTVTFDTHNWTAYYDQGFAIYGLNFISRLENYYILRNRGAMDEVTLDANISRKAVSITFDHKVFETTPTIMAVSMTGRKSATSGIDSIEAGTGNDAEIEAVYNLQGVRLEAPVKGINIIRYTDGTTRKVIVR